MGVHRDHFGSADGWTRRRFIQASATATAGLGASALIGCGGAPARPAAAPDTRAPGAGKAAGPTAASIIGKSWSNREPDGTPKYGGVLSWAGGSPTLAFLDAVQMGQSLPHQVSSNAYSALMRIGRPVQDRNDQQYFPDLATSWETTDPLKMVFKLRPGVKYHNIAPVNGRELTSEDVKFAVMRAASDKLSVFRGNLSAIKGVETPDATTAVVTLNRFDPMIFPDLAGHYAWIVPKELVESAKIREQIIGTGPFIFQRWEKDARIHYKKNPDYFVKGVPFVDELNVLQIGNEDTRNAALKAGQTQIGNVPKPALAMFKDDPKFAMESWLTSNNTCMFMNFKNPIWKDERVRQAHSLAIDWGIMLKILEEGGGQLRGPVSAKFSGWSLSQDEIKSKRFYMRHDLQQAKQLMSAAGHPNGLQTPLVYSTSNPQSYMDHVQYLAQAWEKAGINRVKLVGMDFPTLRKQQDEHSYEALLIGADGQPQPELYLLDYRTGGAKNGSGVSLPELDAEVDKVVATVDLKERQNRAKDLSGKILEKVQYKITYSDGTANEAWNKNTHNYMGIVSDWYMTTGFAYTWLDS